MLILINLNYYDIICFFGNYQYDDINKVIIYYLDNILKYNFCEKDHLNNIKNCLKSGNLIFSDVNYNLKLNKFTPKENYYRTKRYENFLYIGNIGKESNNFSYNGNIDKRNNNFKIKFLKFNRNWPIEIYRSYFDKKCKKFFNVKRKNYYIIVLKDDKNKFVDKIKSYHFKRKLNRKNIKLYRILKSLVFPTITLDNNNIPTFLKK